jgi:uncharacterized protein (DUF952 family)
MNWVLKIARAEDWAAAKASGVYRVPSLEADGFIHLSRPHQVHIPANALYSDTPGLVLLWIDPSRLVAELRYEPGTGGEPMDFPHLYGPLNIDAIVAESPMEPWKNGEFQLPPAPA